MYGLLGINPSDAAPIWRQIEAGMRRLVVSGSLTPGAAAPSVRELSRELRVNPATVGKAYQRLVDAGLLMVRRGEGTFVAERTPEVISADRKQLIQDEARRYVEAAMAVNAHQDEAMEALLVAWKDTEPDHKEESHDRY